MRSLRDHQSTPRDVHWTARGSLNAKVTRRTIFRFAAQLAPGVLMAGRAMVPLFCRGTHPRCSEDGAVPGKSRVDPAD